MRAPPRRAFFLALALAPAFVACTRSATAPSSPHADAAHPLPVPSPPPALPPSPSPSATLAPPPAHQHWIAAGGGSWPGSNQISLAQDLAQVRDALGPSDGLLLFASGPGATVQVLDPVDRGDPLLRRLGALFDDRAGRDAHYAPAPIAPHGVATADGLLDAMRAALAAGSDPLLVYIAAHGAEGETPRDGAVVLWGDTEIGVSDLAMALDSQPSRRPLRLVITACYSGAFAELVFRDAREDQGAASGVRCGLFASTWDHEAAGCDPDPDRREQEGYGLHFSQALRGRDRDGVMLPPRVLDLDGDGRVSLLEAHTRARIAGRSIDVPTTTSERWLRHAAPAQGPSLPFALPEEDAVVTALTRELGLPAGVDTVRARLAAIRAQREDLGTRMDALQDRIDAANRGLMADLLAHWPTLDDPWHPDWSSTLAAHRDEIQQLLDAHPSNREVDALSTERDGLAERDAALEIQSAAVERLVRALENRELAGRLHARGGEGWTVYQRFLACERSAP